MKKLRTAALWAVILLFAVLLPGFFLFKQAAQRLPDTYTVVRGEALTFSTPGLTARRITDKTAQVSETGDTEKSYTAQILLFGFLPVKTVSVSVAESRSVIPCGTPFGIKLFTDGVVVVDTSAISTAAGTKDPAKEAGIRKGDIIREIDERPVTSNEQLGETMEKSGGRPVALRIDRDGEDLTLLLTPARSDYDGKYKGGVWVRDSTAGIGIVTFYDPSTGNFAGLGHGICDADTEALLPLGSGEIVPVCISGITKGKQGNAGRLRGYFSSEEELGTLFRNDETGVYGSLYQPPVQGTAVPFAMKQEVAEGPAQILTTVEGETPRLYDVEIESLDLRDETRIKNMVLHVTDEELLEKTGGIVQGMSGSPVLQNGKLVGAVTHVFLHDPERGYGIFAENMVQPTDN